MSQPIARPRGLVVGVSAFALILILAYRSAFLAMDINSIAPWATVLSAAAIVGVGVSGRTHLWSAGFWYEVTLALFHLGLPWLVALHAPFAQRSVDYLATWFRDGSGAVEAIYLSMLATVAFVPAYALVSRPRVGNADRLRPVPPFGPVGFVLVAVGTLTALGYIALTAPQLLHGGTYSDFDATVAGSRPIGAGMLLTAFGIILTAAAPPSRWRRRAVWVFAFYALVMLSFGARTAAMYAIAAGVLVAVRMRKPPKARVAIVALLIGIVSISVLQQVRANGLSAHTVESVSLNPSDSLTETGGSLRAVVETINLHELHGEPFRHGETYFVGLLRAGERIAGVPRPNPDPRFAGTKVAAVTHAEGFNIGFSAVAEAWLNFGTPGVVGFFLFLGLILGRLDAGALRDPVLAARLGVVMYALLYEVRQASNITLTDIILGLVLIEVVRRLGRKHTRRSPVADQLVGARPQPMHYSNV